MIARSECDNTYLHGDVVACFVRGRLHEWLAHRLAAATFVTTTTTITNNVAVAIAAVITIATVAVAATSVVSDGVAGTYESTARNNACHTGRRW
jgi:hypothetical protein